MGVENLLTELNANVLIFVLTSLFAFLAWIVKGLIEKPLIESKNTFGRFLEKRVEILTEVKTRLNLIAYFPGEEESKEYKNQIQEILLRDGKAGYLNKDVFEAVLRISISPLTNENLLLTTITAIDDDLYRQISKVEDEIQFYKRFSYYNPIKRFMGFAVLSIQYFLAISLLSFGLLLLLYGMVYFSWLIKVVLIVSAIGTSYLINLWMRR